MNHQVFKEEFAGKTLSFEIGKFAEQANGSVLARLGDTVVLSTVTMSKKEREGINYFPLLVDYEEKFYAAGRILGSRFIKREGRPSEEAILTDRLIDRCIRPLFDQSTRRDVQVVATVLSVDGENDPDILAIIATSLTIAISDVPWSGPIAALRISKKEEGFIVNPTYQERESNPLDLVICGTKDKINMIEAGANEVSEQNFLTAVDFGFKFFKDLVAIQEKIISKVGSPKTKLPPKAKDEELKIKVKQFLSARLEKAIYIGDKKEYGNELELLHEELKSMIEENYSEDTETKLSQAFEILDEEINTLVHKNVIDNDRRPDGRGLDEVRPLEIEAGILPRAHGSAMFKRGQTQALSVLTLGAPGDQQLIESMETNSKKRFMHHYNFPPYSVGEISPMRGPGRREIGHGALTEKALVPLIPKEEDFPYTIRLVSETLSSNGSSSMASVCGSSLALMDGGVPIKKTVAGIALGLMTEDKNYKILTDIQGPEDHHGDMDFKVAGTVDGLTALQMDVKIEGVSLEILTKALEQAKKARFQILSSMESVIKSPRPELSPFAPRIYTLQINPDKIREVIGPQGKVINEIIKETGVTIDIEDSGLILFTAPDEGSAQKAIDKVKEITKEIKVGEVFEGRVKKIADFGAFVGLTPNKDGLLRNDELYNQRFSVDSKVKVKVKEIDGLGRINLELVEKPKGFESKSNFSQRDGPHRDKTRPRRFGFGRRHP